MTSPQPRLRQRADFLKLRRAQRVSAAAFTLAMRERGDALPPRIGFTVADKAVRSGERRAGAVRRNRAKRRLREAVRLVASERVQSGHDYVIVARPAALTQDFAALCEDLAAAFARAHRSGRPQLAR